MYDSHYWHKLKNTYNIYSISGKLVNFQYKDKEEFEKMCIEKTLKMPKWLPVVSQGRTDNTMANNTGQKDNYPQNTTQKTNSWATLTSSKLAILCTQVEEK